MLGVLSVLLLLIPSLLLMAQVTRYAQVTVSSPRDSSNGAPSHTIHCGRGPSFEVTITHDGFFTRDHGKWTRVGPSIAGRDHQALAAVVREHKRAFPHQTVAIVSAESDIPYATLVETLDTVRGSGCELAGALSGESVPSDCLLWNPIIRDRVPNWHVPAFRAGQHWPPTPPHEAAVDDRSTSIAG